MPNKPEYTRFLPHYHPIGATFFVTFRLDGSLPLSYLDKLSKWYKQEQTRIYKELPAKEQQKALSTVQRDYFRKFDDALDKCLCGPTFLKNPEAANKTIEELFRFDNLWYRLWAYTIMPNHVHVLLDFSIQIKQENGGSNDEYKNLDYVMGLVKGASSRSINLVLGRTGNRCWQNEYHDRYIRDKRHFLAAVDYIKDNPVSADLCNHWLEHPFTWVHEKIW